MPANLQASRRNPSKYLVSSIKDACEYLENWQEYEGRVVDPGRGPHGYGRKRTSKMGERGPPMPYPSSNPWGTSTPPPESFRRPLAEYGGYGQPAAPWSTSAGGSRALASASSSDPWGSYKRSEP